MSAAHRCMLAAFALLALVDFATATVECEEAIYGYRGNRRHFPDIPMPAGKKDFTVGPLTNVRVSFKICEFGTVHEGTSIRACDYDVKPTVSVTSLTAGSVQRAGGLAEAGVIYVQLHCTTPPQS